MNEYTVYMHINKQNNKRYIGITKQNPKIRWANGKGYVKNAHFYAAIQKYGWNNFEHIILHESFNQEEACLMEKYYIKKYNTINPQYGYNLSEGGFQVGPNNFEKMTEWQRNHKKFGKDNIRSKKVKCIETQDVFGSISEAERWCDSTKVGECCRGQRSYAGHHPETGQILSWDYANDNDEVTIICNTKILNKHKYFDSRSKKVRCIETNEIFMSESEACKKYGASRGTIGRACNGLRKTALKKHWEWVEED